MDAFKEFALRAPFARELGQVDWDAPARALASVGIPAGTAHFVAAMLAATVISWVIPYVPTARGRNLYCAVTGLVLSIYSYGWDTVFLVFATVVSYVFMICSRRRCGPVTWVFGVGFLLIWRARKHPRSAHARLLAALRSARGEVVETHFFPLTGSVPVGCPLSHAPRSRSHVLAGSQERWKKGFIPFTGAFRFAETKKATCIPHGRRSRSTDRWMFDTACAPRSLVRARRRADDARAAPHEHRVRLSGRRPEGQGAFAYRCHSSIPFLPSVSWYANER